MSLYPTRLWAFRDNDCILFILNSPCLGQDKYTRNVCCSNINCVFLRSNRCSRKSIGQDQQIGGEHLLVTSPKPVITASRRGMEAASEPSQETRRPISTFSMGMDGVTVDLLWLRPFCPCYIGSKGKVSFQSWLHHLWATSYLLCLSFISL